MGDFIEYFKVEPNYTMSECECCNQKADMHAILFINERGEESEHHTQYQDEDQAETICRDLNYAFNLARAVSGDIWPDAQTS